MLTIREATPEERASIVDLLIRAFEPITYFKKAEARFGRLNERDWRERFRARAEKALECQTAFVGLEDKALTACAIGGYDPQFRLAYLDLLGVEPAAHGKGHGRRMLRAFEGWAREQGAEAVNLECLTDNDGANQLYQAEGYEEAARQIRWFKRL